LLCLCVYPLPQLQLLQDAVQHLVVQMLACSNWARLPASVLLYTTALLLSSDVPRLAHWKMLQNDWNDHLCHECLNHRDGTAVECDGTCLRMFHMQCLPQHLRPKPTDAADAPWWVARLQQPAGMPAAAAAAK
jgi:hypothetical protein